MTGTGLAERRVDRLADRLSRCYASAVHDVLRSMGHDNCLLPPEIRPVLPGHGVLAGEIWTVSGHIDRTRSAHDTLLRLAVEAGLDAERARQILASDEFADEVRAQEQFFQSRGIHSVPATIVNGQHLISGGQPPEAFEQALRQIVAAA